MRRVLYKDTQLPLIAKSLFLTKYGNLSRLELYKTEQLFLFSGFIRRSDLYYSPGIERFNFVPS